MEERTALKLRLYADPVLRKKAKQVKEVTGANRETLAQMARIMYGASGIGLACPQVGISEAMIVVDAGSGLYKLINPKIIKKEGAQVLEEGCLSIPGVCIKVKRAKKVIIKAGDEFGKPVVVEAQDLLACVFQHEIDHLKGRLIVDYASFFEKLKIKKKLKELKKSASTSLSTSTRSILSERSESKGSQDERVSEEETKSCKLQL